MASVEATTFQFHTDGRIFLAQKNGQVRLIKNGQLQATPVINIGDHVNRAVDRGLLGLALDKNFTANGYMYLAYTVERHGEPQSTDPRTACITRVTVVGDTASPASEVRILGKAGCGDVDSCTELPVGADCLSVDFTSHGNGAIRVDAEGNLWTTMGDGSLLNHAIGVTRAQGVDYLNGKLLRVTRLGKGVPSNPFWNGNENAARSKVYAYGLRNPYRFNAKPGGPVFLGDVGGSRFEEIDVAAPGANFGWPCYENDVRNPAYQSHSRCQALYAAGPTATKAPLHAYSHDGGSAGITGGAFYTGPSAAYNGAYIYADFIKREFRSLRVNAANTAVTSGPTVFGPSLGIPVDIQMGPDGCLWYAALGAAGNLPALRRILFHHRQPRADRHGQGDPPFRCATAGGAVLQCRLQRSRRRRAGLPLELRRWHNRNGRQPPAHLPDEGQARRHVDGARPQWARRVVVRDGVGGQRGTDPSDRCSDDRLPVRGGRHDRLLGPCHRSRRRTAACQQAQVEG